MVSIMTPTVEDIWRALADVMDPEIPVVSVVDMGIIRDVAVVARMALRLR